MTGGQFKYAALISLFLINAAYPESVLPKKDPDNASPYKVTSYQQSTLELMDYNFINFPKDNDEQFPHLYSIGGRGIFQTLTYISIRMAEDNIARIAVAAKIGTDRSPEYQIINDGQHYVVPPTSIADQNPDINAIERQSRHGNDSLGNGKLTLAGGYALNIAFYDKENTKHNLTVSNDDNDYVDAYFGELLPTIGCILYTHMLHVRWDDESQDIAIALPSTSDAEDEVGGYDEDRSCKDQFGKTHNSIFADISSSNRMLASDHLIYISNKHNIFSFPIEWLNPSRSGRDGTRDRFIIQKQIILPALENARDAVLNNKDILAKCRTRAVDCVQELIDSTFLSLAQKK